MSDYYNTDEAIARVAAELIAQDEVAALVDEIYCASSQLLRLIEAAPKTAELTAMHSRIRSIMRAERAAADRIVSEVYESREEGKAWAREVAQMLREDAA